MKNYSEQRGVHSQVIYDAVLDQFLQRVLTHDFVTLIASNKKSTETASIAEFPRQDIKTVDKPSLHKSRAVVMQTMQKRRAG